MATTSTDFITQSPDVIIEHILNTYHRTLKASLTEIETLLRGLKSSNSGGLKHLGLIKEVFFELKNELLEHVNQEEEVLFPLIKKLKNTKGATTLASAQRASLKSSINEMEYEHNKSFDTLEELESLTEDYRFSEETPDVILILFDKFDEFIDDLKEHILFENLYLHPLAFKL